MSHGKLRKDTNCLNCGGQVLERFCGKCGQENTEIRQSFHFLVTHFIEDFTHYDGGFWRTLKALFVKPGRLTNVYLQGKRQVYVPPVKLYIFISFITFFLFAVLPSSPGKNKSEHELVVYEPPSVNIKNHKVTSVHSLNLLRAEGEVNQIDYFISKKILEAGGSKMFAEKLKNGMTHNVPKALFVYLPLFAFFMWLFHNKKKWWYFDNSVFTLHYFSFLLLGILMAYAVGISMGWLDHIKWLKVILSLLEVALITYMAIYFFIAHRAVYKGSLAGSIFKGIVLFFINCIILGFITAGLFFASLYTLH